MALSEYAGKVLYFILLSLVFAFIYSVPLGHEHFNGLDESSNFFDYWYFSFTTFSTVGYGDISPKSGVAKAIVITQQVILLLDLADEFLGLGASLDNRLGLSRTINKGINSLVSLVTRRNVTQGILETPNTLVTDSALNKQVKYDSLINDIKESRPIDALNVTA